MASCPLSPTSRPSPKESPVLIEVLERLTNGYSSYAVVHAVAVDPTSYQQTHHVTAIAGDLDDLKGDAVAIDTDYASVIHVRLGDVATIRVNGVAHDLRVVAVLPSTSTVARSCCLTGTRAPEP